MSSGVVVPSLVLGKNKDGEPVEIQAEHRFRGTLVVGQAGLGKSSLLTQCALQDAKAGMGMLVVDPHTMVQELIARIPEERIQDVVVISFRHNESPLWPVLDIARRDDEQLVVAQHLIDAWRAQYGPDSIQARAESVLANGLLAIPKKSGISPVELLAVLCLDFYRWACLQQLELHGADFGLKAYFEGTIAAVGPRTFQEWAQSVVNKILPLINYTWLRRAMAGTPAGRGDAKLPAEILWQTLPNNPISRATWVRDGRIVIERQGLANYGVIQVDNDELDGFLLDYAAGDIVNAPGFKGGPRKALTKYVYPDTEDLALAPATPEEISTYGEQLQGEISRRRRKRAWRRLVDYELLPRGVVAREAIDIADLLDDGRIVLVEVPKVGGQAVTQAAATFALLAAVVRGHRQTVLPEHRRVPISIYIDEAELFLTAGVEETLQELRKANVAITLSLQRFGQLDSTGRGLRAAVMNTVGSIVTLAVGRGEVKETAEFLHEKEETVMELKRGEGLLATLTKDWSHDKVKQFSFERTAPTPEDLSHPIRKASIARFHQTTEEADAVFSSRVRAIMKTVSTKSPGD